MSRMLTAISPHAVQVEAEYKIMLTTHTRPARRQEILFDRISFGGENMNRIGLENLSNQSDRDV